MGNVQSFYTNKAMRDDVRDYIYSKMDKLALERMYKGENTAGFKEAKEVLAYALHCMALEFEQAPVNKKDVAEFE